MELTEHIALYLQGQGLPCAVSAQLPIEPDEAIAVIATGLRPAADSEGSRFQLLVRSRPGEDSALSLSSRVLELLVGFCGLLTPDSPLILRTQLEGGAARLDADSRGRVTYSMNFRAWHC